jgi:endonuclease YncB( thermonuclease family)
MRRFLPLILILLVPWLFVSVALADDLITAKVVGVTDGDSITVLAPGDRQDKIRLHGIDCPESGQAFGKRAKQFTSNQCFGKTITYRKMDIDRYGRTVATVYLDDGRELNLEIIKAGYAWHYRRYSDRQDYADAEAQARSEKLGLWSDPHAKPPWEWRREKRRKF